MLADAIFAQSLLTIQLAVDLRSRASRPLMDVLGVAASTMSSCELSIVVLMKKGKCIYV
jgi:hypothetical protein